MSSPAPADQVAWPILSAAEMSEIASFGVERAVADGELLFAIGEPSDEFFVVLEGEVEIVGQDGRQEVVLAEYGPGGFVGELSLLTGQRRFVTGRVKRAGRVLVIEQAEFRRLNEGDDKVAATALMLFLQKLHDMSLVGA